MIRIQKIGHVGLYCKDIKKMIEFYTDVLGFKLTDMNERGMAFLRFGPDHHNLFLCPMTDADRGGRETALHHVSFEVAGLEELKRVKKYLEGRGIKILDTGKIVHRPTGSNYDFDIHDPEGNIVQFYADMDQIGWDGNSRPKELRKEFVVEDD